MANHFTLASTLSPQALTSLVADHEPRIFAGLDIGIIPPLNCYERYVRVGDIGKYEETNKSPVLPRLRLAAIREMNLAKDNSKMTPVGMFGLGFMPPIQVLQTWTLLISAEAAIGLKLNQQGVNSVLLRGHVTSMRTVGDIALAFEEDAPAIEDLFVGSSLGLGLVLTHEREIFENGALSGSLSAGILDTSSVFVVGDDDIITPNQHPYLGPELSLSAAYSREVRSNDVRPFISIEGYVAPGGHRSQLQYLGGEPYVPEDAVKGFRAYGNLATLKLNLGLTFE